VAPTALKKRTAKTYPLVLDLEDGDAKFTRSFLLLLDFNALAAAEEKAGTRMIGIAFWTRMSARMLTALLWAAALRYQPEYATVDKDGNPTDDGFEVIGSYIDPGNESAVAEALWEAYLVNMPQDRQTLLRKLRAGEEKPDPNGQEPAEPPASNQPGSTSGPSPDTTSVSAIASSAS